MGLITDVVITILISLVTITIGSFACFFMIRDLNNRFSSQQKKYQDLSSNCKAFVQNYTQRVAWRFNFIVGFVLSLIIVPLCVTLVKYMNLYCAIISSIMFSTLILFLLQQQYLKFMDYHFLCGNGCW